MVRHVCSLADVFFPPSKDASPTVDIRADPLLWSSVQAALTVPMIDAC